MDRYLDYWNLMCYDYAGSWDRTSGHAANLYASPDKPETTPFNTDQAVSAYLRVGIPAHKIIIGMPLYGRAFGETQGPGTSFTSIPAGHYEPGVYDYKDLPLSNRSVIQEDSKLGASWSYDSAQRVMVSFDTQSIVNLKAKYIRKKGLGGGVFWEASGDGSRENSLIFAFLSAIGGKQVLQQSPNHILYPDSKYENIRSVPSSLEDL
ncbi:Chitinase 4 [Aspergillus melleus]|uniref:Chitinase 4 n=1 Tax=Aspergillus melleus TaxID=138277 RepID=UPI001E8CB564|nr:Chitinase 4 [Aspergillus melleus]KAH8430998.1 Chitinase 4 [Aspergillus melleus]